MPTVEHEAPLMLLRNQPELAAHLCRTLGVDMPEYQEALMESADLTEVTPSEYRADAVVVLRAAEKEPVQAIVVEVQRSHDDQKQWSWPIYLAGLRARLKCGVALLVICTKTGVAAKCRAPIQLGHPGWVLIPLVVDPRVIPMMSDVEQAAKYPEMTVLSALTHGDGINGTGILDALSVALDTLDPELARQYAELVLVILQGDGRRHMEALMMTETYEYQSDLAKRYEARGRIEGKAEGKAEAVVNVLLAREVAVPEEARARILACGDAGQLDAWIQLAVTVDSADALFT